MQCSREPNATGSWSGIAFRSVTSRFRSRPGLELEGLRGQPPGEVKLDGGGFHRARAHTSKLVLEINGSLRARGPALAGRWDLRRSQSIDQHTETLKDQLASSR